LTHHAPATEVDRRVSVGESSPRGSARDLSAAGRRMRSFKTEQHGDVSGRHSHPEAVCAARQGRSHIVTDCADGSHGGWCRRDP